MRQVDFVLNIDMNKSLNSLRGLKNEMKEVQKAMENASGENLIKLNKRFIDLRDQAEDLNAKLQPLDKQIGVLTKGVGGLANVGSGLATVFGADNKSAEALFKTFAKAQAITQVVNGFNEMVDLLPKVASAFTAVGNAMKSAFLANPVTAIIIAVAALSSAIAIGVYQLNELSTVTDEATRSTELMNDATDKAIENSAKEKVEYGTMFTALKEVNLSTKERAALIKKINESGYIDKLLTEKSSIEDINNAQKELNNSLLMKFKLQALEEQLVETYKTQAQAIKDVKEAMNPGFMGKVIDVVSQAATSNAALTYSNWELAGAIDASKEAAQDKKILEEQIAIILKDNTKLLDLDTAATDKNTKAKEKQYTEFDKYYKKLAEEQQKQLDAVPTDPTVLLNNAGLMTPSQLNDYLIKNTDIENQNAEKQIEINKKKNEENIQNEQATYAAIASISGSLSQIIGEETRAGAIASRAAALFQIGVSTAQAIAGATAASASNPANASTFGGAGLAQFAAMFATIMANIAKAKELLNTPLPFATGGLVPGAGSNDSINSMLTPGEFVIKKSVVEQIGVSNLNRLNNNMPMTSRVFVTDYDISKVQKNTQRVETRSTLKKLRN